MDTPSVLKPYPFGKPKILKGATQAESAAIEKFKTNDFFKFLFFDQYVINGGGSNYYPIVEKFRQYIEKFQPKTDKVLWPIYKSLFITKDVWQSTVTDYSVFNEFYNKNKHYILLSGWSVKDDGHAITVYFKRLGPNKNEIYFINSGSGLPFHGPSIDGKRPIVVKFSDKSDNEVKAVYQITQFFCYYGIEDRDSQLSDFLKIAYNTFNHQLQETRVGGDEIIEGFYEHNRFLTRKLVNDLKLHTIDLSCSAGWGRQQRCGETVEMGSPFKFPEYFYELIAEFYIQCSGGKNMWATLYYTCMFNALSNRPPPTPPPPPPPPHEDNADNNLYAGGAKDDIAVPTIVAYGVPQLSDSCTFYSSYHFIKTFVIQEPTAFTAFINKVKHVEAETMLSILKTLTTSSGFINNTIVPTVINSSLMLLKDPSIASDLKGAIRSHLHTQLPLFNNSCMNYGSIQGNHQESGTDNYDQIADMYRSFMTGEKSLVKLLESMKWFDVNRQYVNRIYRWKFIFVIKMAIALFNATVPTLQIPILEQNGSTNPYFEWLKEQPIYTDCEKLEWFNLARIVREPGENESPRERLLQNILVQCFLKQFILPEGLTEIPFFPTVELKEDDQRATFGDAVVIGVIYNDYMDTSYAFLKDFPTERMYKQCMTFRGLLTSTDIAEDSLYLACGLLSRMCKVKLMANQSGRPSVVTTINKLPLINDEGLDSAGAPATIFSRDHWLFSTDAITELQNAINIINVKNIKTIPKTLDTMWSYISLITEESSSNNAFFSGKQRLRTTTPPTYMNRYFTGRSTINYYEVDKRNDFLKYCMESLNRESFLAVYKELPAAVLENILYFLYLYDKPFVLENKDDLVKCLNAKTTVSYLLDDNVDMFSRAYIYGHARDKEGLYLNAFLETDVESDCVGFRQFIAGMAKRIPGFTLSGVDIGYICGIAGYTKDREEKPNTYWYMKGENRDEYPIEVESVDTITTRRLNGKVYTLEKQPLESLLVEGYADEPKNKSGNITRRANNRLPHAKPSRALPMGSVYQNSILLTLLLKLSTCGELVVWESEEDIMIELLDYKHTHFIFTKLSSSVAFIDENANAYTLLTNYSHVLGVWVLATTNVFLVERSGQTSLLVLLSGRYANAYFKQKVQYWGRLPRETKEYPSSELNKVYQTIVPLQFTGLALSFDTNKSLRDDISALYLSYYCSDNCLALNLLYPYYRNLDGTAATAKDVYKPTTWKLDNPLWGLYFGDEERTSFYEFLRPANTDHYFDTAALNQKENLKVIHSVCDELDKLKATIGTKNFVPGPYLDEFLKTFRYVCTPMPLEKRFESMSHFEYYMRDAANDLLYLTDKTPTPAYLYSKYYLELYTHLIDIKYERIVRSLSADDYSCGFVLKMIESLDKVMVYGFENPRSLEEVLFELQSSNFLRRTQKVILERMIAEPQGVANEILMGQGKTTTLTPMLLLYKYYQEKVQQFSVVLPSHLVPQSYEIAFSLLPIMDTFMINRNAENYIALRTADTPVLQIISDTVMKHKILISYIEKPVEFKHDFCIFDEVDTLLNALKSDLNLPYTGPTSHPSIDFIFTRCFTAVNNYIHESSVPVMEAPHELSVILEKKLATTMQKAHTMTYNQNYGFGTVGTLDPVTNKWKNAKGLFTAVPYNANHSPINDSEFTDFELFIVLTILSYFKSPVRTIDIEELLKEVVKKLNLFKQLYEAERALKEIVVQTFFPEVFAIFETTSLMSALQLMQTNKSHEKELKGLAKQIDTAEKKTQFVYVYMKQIVLKRYTKIYLDQYNISMVDMFKNTVSYTKASFSGTVNFNLPGRVIKDSLFTSGAVHQSLYNGQITTIQEDLSVRASIEASFYGFTTREPELYTFIQNKTIEEDLLMFVTQAVQNYQALIDTCGIILNTRVEDVARRIQQAAPTKTILFVNGNDVRQVMLPDGRIENYKNETFQDVFMYYDHKHCVGTDFKQPFKMHGLITVGAKNNLTEISQGIFRLRNINIGHSVDFYCSELLKLGETDSAANTQMTRNTTLFKTLKVNDTAIQKASLPASQLQCGKYVDRIFTEGAYGENIYFDTISEEHRGAAGGYVTFEEFIKRRVRLYNQHLETVFPGLQMKDTIGSRDADALATNVELNVEENVEVDVDIVVNTSIMGKQGVPVEYKRNNAHFTVTDYVNLTGAFHSIPDLTIFDEDGKEWSVLLSPAAEEFVKVKESGLDARSKARWYYFTNNSRPNTLLVLSYPEAIVLLNCLKQMDTTGIALYDSACTEYSTSTNVRLPRVVRLLLGDTGMSIFEKFNTLRIYCKHNKSPTQLKSYYTYLGFEYDFHKFRCEYGDIKPENPSAWIFTFNLPELHAPIGASAYEQEKLAEVEKQFMGALTTIYYSQYPKEGGARKRRRTFKRRRLV